ncbi:MAG: Gfo/Idh/MocA family oxidoreductase, partial [Candidatus Binatia bacterium]
MKKLRGAIVGFGNVAAEAHVPGFERAKGYEIVAAVDPVAQRRAEAKARLPEARMYETLEQLAAAEPKLEFLDIATPPRFHA